MGWGYFRSLFIAALVTVGTHASASGGASRDKPIDRFVASKMLRSLPASTNRVCLSIVDTTNTARPLRELSELSDLDKRIRTDQQCADHDVNPSKGLVRIVLMGKLDITSLRAS